MRVPRLDTKYMKWNIFTLRPALGPGLSQTERWRTGVYRPRVSMVTWTHSCSEQHEVDGWMEERMDGLMDG